MKEEFTFYVGVDWGVEFHQACILDAHGEKICQRRIEHSGPGMLEFCDFLQALTHGEASALAVAIEVPRGPIVEALLEHNTRYSRSIQSNALRASASVGTVRARRNPPNFVVSLHPSDARSGTPRTRNEACMILSSKVLTHL